MDILAVSVVMMCVVTNTQTNALATKQDVRQGTCNWRGKEARTALPNGTDVYEYTGAVMQRLGWTQVVMLSNERSRLEELAQRMEGLAVQHHVIHCNASTDVQVDTDLLDSLTRQKTPNIVIAGTECLQRQLLNWLDMLPLQIGPMSFLVQDTRWLIVLSSHVTNTTNITSFPVNHVLFVVDYSEDRQVSLKTLTWTAGGRHLAAIMERSLSHLDPALLYPNVGFGLNGMSLCVAINTWTPYIMEEERNGRTEYHGFSMDLLEIFSEAMNFSYNLMLPADGEWGDYRDGRWTGVVGQIDRKASTFTDAEVCSLGDWQQREEVDFSVAPLTPRVERGRVVDWSVPFTFRYTGLAVRSSSDTAYLVTALLWPFSWQLYAFVLVAFICCACTLSILLTMEEKLLQQRQTVPSIFLIFEFLYGSFLKEIVPNKLMEYCGVRRPLVACWCIFSLLVTSSYTSKLTSLLVDVSPPPPFESMQEMVDSGDFRWGVVGGTALLNSFRQSNNTLMKAVYQGIMTFVKDDPDVLSLSAEVHRNKMAAGGYAYIGEEGLLELWAADDCALRVIRERVVGMETYNVFTPKHSVLTRRIDQVLLKLEAAGIMRQLHTKWWPGQESCSNDSSTQSAISLATMQGLFYAAAGGLLVAAAALLTEKLVGHRHGFRRWCPTWLVTPVLCKVKN